MKSQVPHFVLLLLLLALFHGAECAVAKYTRKVKGRILGQNVNQPFKLDPVFRGSGSVECQATVTYTKPSKTTTLRDFNFFLAGPKGEYSTSLTFTDNNYVKNSKVSSFVVSCVLKSGEGAELTKTIPPSSASVIDAGDIVAYWTLPLQVKGSLTCSDSSKPISNLKLYGFCQVDFTPAKSYGIVVSIKTRKDGSISSSALIYFGPEQVPLSGSYSETKLTCEITPPTGTSVEQAFKPVVINSGSYDLGEVFLQDNTPKKKFCKP